MANWVDFYKNIKALFKYFSDVIVYKMDGKRFIWS